MNKELFTILIPTVNRLHLVQRALASSFAQTEPARILLSDNGSADGTREWMTTLEHPLLSKRRIETTVSSHEHGKTLWPVIDTEWVVILSDDDFLEPTFIEELTASLKDHPEARVLYCQARIHLWDVAYEGKAGPPVEAGWEFMLHFMRGDRNPCFCAMAFRMADLREVGIAPPELYLGDMYYWVRILTKGPIVCVHKPLSHYVQVRDALDSATSGAPLVGWMEESEGLARDMSRIIRENGGATAPREAELARARAHFLAATFANQVLWNILRGRNRASIWLDALKCLRFYALEPSIWPRVLGGSFLSKRFIKRAVRLTMLKKYGARPTVTRQDP